MRKYVKIVAFILVLLLISLVVVACGEHEDIDLERILSQTAIYLKGFDSQNITLSDKDLRYPDEKGAIPADAYGDIVLPTEYSNGDVKITWQSDTPEILSAEGKYTAPTDVVVEVVLTAKINARVLAGKGNKQADEDGYVSANRTELIAVKVHRILEASDVRMAKVKEWLAEQMSFSMISDSIVCPTETDIPKALGVDAKSIEWESNNLQLLSNKGELLKASAMGKVTLTAYITLNSGETDSFTKELTVVPAMDTSEMTSEIIKFVKAYLEGAVPENVGSDLELVDSFDIGIGEVKIRWMSTNEAVLDSTGAFTAPEQQTNLTVTALVSLPDGNAFTFVKPVNAIPENAYPDAIRSVIRDLEHLFGNEQDRVFAADIPSSYMITTAGNGAEIVWTSSKNAVIDGSGKFIQPTFDKEVVLTARISVENYKVDYPITVTAKGVFDIPSPDQAKKYLTEILGDTISTDLYLPCRYNQADYLGQTTDVLSEDVKIAWSVSAGDATLLENGNRIVRKVTPVEHVQLTAKLSFDGALIGELVFSELTVEAVSREEMYRYAKQFVKENLTMNVATGFTLPIETARYGIKVDYRLSNDAYGSFDGQGGITVKDTTPNMTPATIIATFTAGTPLGDANYNVNLISANEVIARYGEYSELIPDETLRKILVKKFGTMNVLTTASFRSTNMLDDKWYNLDLSDEYLRSSIGKKEYKKITSLKGIGYVTTLGYLNIAGQDKITDLSEVCALKNLEVLIASNCGIKEFNDGGVSPFRQLKKLTVLDLSHNEIESSDILEGSDYTALQYLYLNDNRISDVSSLSLAVNVEYLALDHNSISDIAALSELTNLKELTLNDNAITNVKPLGGLIRLEKLDLSNQKELSIIGALKSLTQMRVLSIAGNKIDSISALREMTALEVLDASNNRISAGASAVKNFTSIRKLFLHNNRLGEETTFISGLTHLTHLTLSNNAFNTQTFEEDVKDLIELEVLTISSTNKSFRITRLDFLDNMPNLFHLEIPYAQIEQTY
ncbi:MAG: leucine-rich repeat domain-containing protein, partial [Clostridia bacterium]|nr:leucine-rich repeat domain-containing protein [Clostridia bacterium]